MTYVILDRLNAWKLKQRLPFYVQLAHACPEDLDDPRPNTFLIAISKIGRGIFDFLQWKHPVGRVERRNFVRAFTGNREIHNRHEKAFLSWRQKCWHDDYYPCEISSPPYKKLFLSELRLRGGDAQYRLLDEENDKFFADKALPKEDLTWFKNAIREDDEAAEDAYLEDYIAEMQEQWSKDSSTSYEDDVIYVSELSNEDFIDYAPDDYGADEYEYYAEQYLYGADPDT